MQFKRLLFLLLIFTVFKAYSQQDVEFHLNSHLLPGKNILKVKRDFRDPYLWVLAQNNEVYRINSVTLAVDNYTSTFAAYGALQFIDIAGRSQDTVFIATNSTNVVEYKKGIIKVIGAADGIATVVNSVGINKEQEHLFDTFSLVIGSDKGLYFYDMIKEKVTDGQINASKVFEATYRDLVYKDSTATYQDWDGRKYVPVIIKGEFDTFGYFVSESDIIGHNVNTVYQAFASMYQYDDLVDYTALFWGTRNGMWQVSGDESYFINRPLGHYLDGINVNKITAMFGLTAFGNGNWFGYPGLIKQNLLIGTDKGLYFSKSIYQKWSSEYYGTREIELFHFDPLGNMVINDVCTNTASAAVPVCDDGVWVAAQDGLYLLKPDYSKYLNSASINAIQFTGQDAAVSEMQICTGSNTTASLNTSTYSGHTIQWYKNGIELPGESSNTLTITKAGNYSAVVYDPCENIHLNTNSLKVTEITAPTVTLNYPDKNPFCDGSTATFTVDANTNYQYRWYTDGVLNGNTTNTISVTESGKYKVEVSACSDSWVSSKEIEADFIKLPALALKIDKTSYCIGEKATLSINVPANASYTINWLRDGTPLSDYTNKTAITTDVAGSYSVNISSDEITCSESSPILPVVFNPLPTISLEKIVNTTLCEGQTVDLKATFSGGTVKWSTGETDSRISVRAPGDYTATVTSASGCVDSKTINVAFFTNPVLSLQDATLCQFTQQQITLNAPPGFTKYVWNGVEGGDSFTTGSLGTVELTLTDQNGCTASQTINLTSYCTEIKMGNTFTPNGDGVNDTWTIEGLDNTATVKVYNRLGSLLLNSRGYNQPWDATYNGSKVPPGTYYYIINAKAGTQVLSGWICIIY